MVATSRPIISAPELAPGAISLKRSVMAKMPNSRKAVRITWSSSACIGVIASPGWVKNTPAAPPASRVSPCVWL